MPRMVSGGDEAPDFTLSTASGDRVSPTDFRGKSRVVLYFYPKDDTPGCTAEACSFRDHAGLLKKAGAVILGVSPDGPESHGRFSKKHELPFPLLSDEKKIVSRAYGVWKKKTLYGRTYMGIERSTFVIDEKGKIIKAFRKVKVNGHTQEILDALKGA